MLYTVHCQTLIDDKPSRFTDYDTTTLKTDAKPGTKGFINPLTNCLVGFGVPKAFVSQLNGHYYSTNVVVCDKTGSIVFETIY